MFPLLNWICNASSYPYNLTISQYLAIMHKNKTDFLCLIDDAGRYIGNINIYDLIEYDSRLNIRDTNITLLKLPEITLDICEDELMQMIKLHSVNKFVVIDFSRNYLGVLNISDFLMWYVHEINTEKFYLNTILNNLGYNYFVVSKTGSIRNNSQFYKMLNIPEDKILSLSDMPGSTYILKALELGVDYTNIETQYSTRNLFVNIWNVNDEVLVTFADKEHMYHRVILETIFDSMREGINVVDQNGIIIYCNLSCAQYANAKSIDMIGKFYANFYPDSVFRSVIQKQQPVFDTSVTKDGRIFLVTGIPIFFEGVFKGGISIFREITELIELTTRLTIVSEQIDNMQLELDTAMRSDVFSHLVGADGSMREAIDKARRCIAALGGPRHCVITGETGTGKTTLAQAMYQFAKKNEIISSDAPLIEINCAQFTNSDIAALEIFGSERGSFTGALDKKGLIEVANGGILFLDEAHHLGNYQTMLLKVIEEGVLRRVGGRSDIKVKVIIIAASSQNLQHALLPELYQRLAQYQIHLNPLHMRPDNEKKLMLNSFCHKYEQDTKNHYGIELSLTITPQAKKLLLSAYYPRNIRQFRDTVYSAIDNAMPLISYARIKKETISGIVDISHLPNEVYEEFENKPIIKNKNEKERYKNYKIADLYEAGLGPRKIAKLLKSEGIAIEYYQVAYQLKKLVTDSLRSSDFTTTSIETKENTTSQKKSDNLKDTTYK